VQFSGSVATYFLNEKHARGCDEFEGRNRITPESVERSALRPSRSRGFGKEEAEGKELRRLLMDFFIGVYDDFYDMKSRGRTCVAVQASSCVGLHSIEQHRN
jgi:hypothetical protein